MTDHRQTLEQFYEAHRDRLFVCALAVTRCRDLAEDAIQNVFLRLFRRLWLPRNLKAYVFRSVRNAAIDALRRRASAPLPLDVSIFAANSNPREDAGRAEFIRRAQAALDELAPDERETVIQRVYGDLTFREIAEIRNAPPGTVASWYRRGIQKLRQRLED